MNIKKLIVALGLAGLGCSMVNAAFAAETADLTVRGTITLGACTPTLDNGGVVDLGKTRLADIGTGINLPDHHINLNIACTAPTAVGFTTTDNRAGTSTYIDPQMFGLGESEGKKLGRYDIVFRDATYDTTNGAPVVTADGGQTYKELGVSLADNLYADASHVYTVAKHGQLTAQPFQNGVFDLTIEARLDPEAGLTADATLDGAATISIVYL